MITALSQFIKTNGAAVCAELVAVRGSSPRATGTFMLISADETLGTIGGGALEYMVIARARQVLRDGLPDDSMDIPLGPEIGQCCGGRVEVKLSLMTATLAVRLTEKLEAEERARPHVFLFGAGHVGHALAKALSLLPLKVHVIDTRPEALEDFPESVETQAVALPEAVVRVAPERSSFVILTHDHALDFLIAAEALKRSDCPYVGMVGSRSKRGKFKGWYLGEGGDPEALRRLVLPIGAAGLGDKRPEVIAALAAAEIMVHIGRREAENLWMRPETNVKLGADVE